MCVYIYIYIYIYIHSGPSGPPRPRARRPGPTACPRAARGPQEDLFMILDYSMFNCTVV